MWDFTPTAPFSIGDAIGLPQEHMDFAIGNGMDGLALTDHGSMCGISHQQVKQSGLKKQGRVFKAIPGVEAYFVDSLSTWQKLLDESKVATAEKKAVKKQKANAALGDIGNELATTESELEAINAKPSEEEEGGSVVEDENESKSKYTDPIKQRNHLVLLPKNSDGVKALFRLVSESYAHGFYRYPRIDMDMLRKHAKGNIIGLSACIAGRLAKVVFDNVDDVYTTDFSQNFETIQTQLKGKIEEFVEVFGGYENFYAEIQFNKLQPQHLVNFHLLEAAKRTGVKLVATADSHYANPAHWKQREVYKAMAWASKTKGEIDPSTLAQKIEDLKCELYPKNAEQMWEAYKLTSAHYPFYSDHDQVVLEAVERTHDIAHQQIGNLSVDRSVKLPVLTALVSSDRIEKIKAKLGADATEDDIAYKELVRVAVEGLKARGKADQDVYIERLKTELEDIKYLQENSPFRFAKYFLTYKTIMDVTGKELLTGNGRGSVSGSLLAYVLNISQVDPIRFGTLWERFLSRKKQCLLPTTYVMTASGPKKLGELTTTDSVLTHTGEYKLVYHKHEGDHQELIEFELEDGTKFVSSPNHIWVVERDGVRIEVFASDIRPTDNFIKKL